MEERIERTSKLDEAIEFPDFDGYTSYEDGDALVVCDRRNPNAWVRSDETAELRA